MARRTIDEPTTLDFDGVVARNATLVAGRRAARSVGGKVTADVALRPDGEVQISTVAGEVALRLPATTSAEVNLTSATGRVEAAFHGLDRTDRTVAKSLSGKLGDGSGRIG